MIDVFQGFLEDNGVEALFEELLPNLTIAEAFVEMYDNGMIPNDLVEKFLED